MDIIDEFDFDYGNLSGDADRLRRRCVLLLFQVNMRSTIKTKIKSTLPRNPFSENITHFIRDSLRGMEPQQPTSCIAFVANLRREIRKVSIQVDTMCVESPEHSTLHIHNRFIVVRKLKGIAYDVTVFWSQLNENGENSHNVWEVTSDSKVIQLQYSVGQMYCYVYVFVYCTTEILIISEIYLRLVVERDYRISTFNR